MIMGATRAMNNTRYKRVRAWARRHPLWKEDTLVVAVIAVTVAGFLGLDVLGGVLDLITPVAMSLLAAVVWTLKALFFIAVYTAPSWPLAFFIWMCAVLEKG